MGSYIGNSTDEQKAMMKELGISKAGDLFSCIPESVRLNRKLQIPEGRSEFEVIKEMEHMAGKNRCFPIIFRGAGAYRHYIPAIVRSVTGKEEFMTAYTPYQPEISQGILQAVFEYQTMICELTGMDVSNASVYDGAVAAAEAVSMCMDNKKKQKICVSASADPKVIEVIRTYCFGKNIELCIIPEKEGITDKEAADRVLKDNAGCLYIQQPNYHGCVEPAEELGRMVHQQGAKYIIGGNPIAMAYMQTPGEAGADIAVGEGQPLGIPLSWGGPYLGFMACRLNMMRKMPGRYVGETRDIDGKRAYVLTLQAREQHIRREKANSNICTNQELCAVAASVYMAALGGEGIRSVAEQCMAKAHYLCRILTEAGLSVKYEREFFHEFVTTSHISAERILKHLEKEGILGGLPVGENDILWCATEVNTKEEMDKTAELVREVCSHEIDI